MKLFEEYRQDEAGIGERIKLILGKKPVNDENPPAPEEILGLLDMTTLEGSDNDARVKLLCRQAMFSGLAEGLPDAAAVCVYPSLVRIARQELMGTGIKVASVAGAFPSGLSSLHVKLEEVRFAVGEGAQEIDTVISRGKLLEGRESEVFDELAAIRETCGDLCLKVILETGELGSVANIRKAGEIAILAGADFIKTSTGKIPVGATPRAFLIMVDTINDYLQKTGKSVGVKAAGGIRTTEQAFTYVRLAQEILGKQYINKDLFRIGASSLAKDLLDSILASDLPSNKKN